jgi:GMP synthase (glutamine-hydrolysing)
MSFKEIGFSPVTLTTEGRRSPLAAFTEIPVLHWHGDQFKIPVDAINRGFHDVLLESSFRRWHLYQCSRMERWF